VQRPADAQPVPACSELANGDIRQLATTIDPLSAELENLASLIASDPRAVEAEQDWSECMADRGFGYASEQAMRDSFLQRVIQASSSADGVNASGIREAVAADNDPLREALAPLAELERSAAEASLGCSAGRNELFELIRFEVETVSSRKPGGSGRASAHVGVCRRIARDSVVSGA